MRGVLVRDVDPTFMDLCGWSRVREMNNGPRDVVSKSEQPQPFFS